MALLQTPLSLEDKAALVSAHYALEHPSLAARLTSVLGTPVEQGLRMLPAGWHRRIDSVAETSIRRAMNVAISSLERPGPPWPAKVLGVASGALGGWFGAPALILELPVSTVIMLRAIAQIAKAEGEDLSDLEARLACMQVFALGGRSESDDAAETGYYGIRVALAVHLSNIAQSGGAVAGSAAVIKFVRALAHRFGIVLSQKAAMQMVPVISAATGALVNGVFVQHFEAMARGHFTIRRLERKYGVERVEAEYKRIETAWQ